MTITIEQFVEREVIYNVSSLISEMCKFEGHEAQEQAFELYQGKPDYEEAAIQNNWVFDKAFNEWVWTAKDGEEFSHETAQEICETHNIEPDYPEIFQHWIVSDWLADKLIAKGETVDKDFMGLTVWGRRTCGQAISNDYVIEQIYKGLVG